MSSYTTCSRVLTRVKSQASTNCHICSPSPELSWLEHLPWCEGFLYCALGQPAAEGIGGEIRLDLDSNGIYGWYLCDQARPAARFRQTRHPSSVTVSGSVVPAVTQAMGRRTCFASRRCFDLSTRADDHGDCKHGATDEGRLQRAKNVINKKLPTLDVLSYIRKATGRLISIHYRSISKDQLPGMLLPFGETLRRTIRLSDRLAACASIRESWVLISVGDQHPPPLKKKGPSLVGGGGGSSG